jgi:hypothetical protein
MADVAAPVLQPNGILPNVLGNGGRRPALKSLKETGMSPRFLEELTLKILYNAEQPSLRHLVSYLGLPRLLAEELISTLKARQLCEVEAGSGDALQTNWRYRLTEKGMRTALEALQRNRYAGAVPVPLYEFETYLENRPASERQGNLDLSNCFNEMELPPAVQESLQVALGSGQPVLLHGPSGNGKSLAFSLVRKAIRGTVRIPRSLYVRGQIIRLFDADRHEPAPQETGSAFEEDPRWITIRQPFIVAGAEIDEEDLDLTFDVAVGFHNAPPQLKATGGMLLIDDFGRQRVDAGSLANRWMVAREQGGEMLTLGSGEKIKLPFEATVLFASSFAPKTLMHDGQLRRIPFKVRLPNPDDQAVWRLLGRACQKHEVQVDQQGMMNAVGILKEFSGGDVRSSYPDQLMNLLAIEARFRKQPAVMDTRSFRAACERYFLTDED